jgi:type IVB pilus formation R64 PilN family outer membrane protein
MGFMTRLPRLHGVLTILLISAGLLLNGCSADDRADTKEQLASIGKDADESIDQMRPNDESSALTEDDSSWLGARAVPIQTGDSLPEKMEKDDSLVLTFEQPLSLDQLAARIQAATSLRVTVQKAGAPAGGSNTAPAAGGTGGGASSSGGGGEPTFLPADGLEVTGGRTVWQGKLSNLLDQIADRFDAEWHYTDKTIHLSQQVVRTFMLHALAGSTDVGGSVKTSSGGSGGDSGLPQQSVDSTSKLALWDEIQKSIETITQGKARASFSPATGTITVAGYPSAVNATEEYLKLQNRLRLRRVGIEAKILTVKLDKKYDHNLDVDVVIADAFNNQGIIFSTARGADAATRAVTAGVVRNIPATLGTRDTTQALVNALSAISTQVAVEYSGNLVTLSDQPAPLQVATKRAYVARASSNAGQTTTSASLEPGTIDIGLSMNLLPRVIEEDRVMLRIALGITDLVQLREFSSGGSTVQLPEVDTTGFLQNAVLQSGETLVLAGFEKKNGSYNRNGVGNPNFFALGGGETFEKAREIRVLLLTAHILPEEPINVIRP